MTIESIISHCINKGQYIHTRTADEQFIDGRLPECNPNNPTDTITLSIVSNY
ncbi:MAG: hypothetical protein JW795_17875 [Chitinivibrionales bacterium]|nr:hypothetical protein [Chitinivibrionales bacterium]